MVDNADEKPEVTTTRPPKGEPASDVYSSATIVRDTPGDLKELIRASRDGEARPAASVPPGKPSEAANHVADSADSALPSSRSARNEPPRASTPPVKKPDAVPNKVDDLWESLPKHDGDDDDDEGSPGSATGHAAEDVTKMMMMPEGLLPPNPAKALSADALRRMAEAQPSIVVGDDNEGLGAHSPLALDAEDEDASPGSVTSPGRAAADAQARRLRSLLLALASLAVVVLIYYAFTH